MPEGKTGQYAGRFELAQAGREHVRWYSEVALQIAVALRPVEQPLHDEQCPPGSDDVEGRTKIYESMVKGENTLEAGTPASFDVLTNEIRGLGLNMQLEKKRI